MRIVRILLVIVAVLALGTMSFAAEYFVEKKQSRQDDNCRVEAY